MVPRRCASASVLAVLVTLLVVTACTSRDEGPRPCLVAAASDVAGEDSYESGAAQTADLISAHRPRKVLALGDLAYSDGTVSEFADYYDPAWGDLKDITAPTPGNHEYESDGKGYFDYFDVEPNYAFDLCGWRIVSVDQYASMKKAAAFIEKQGKAADDAPLLVFWHEPRFSSGTEHGTNADMQPLWEAAVDAGAEIVLNGHDHDYERFEPMDADGDRRADGTVEFVSGNGGHELRKLGDREPHSAAAVAGKPGVLFLTLRKDGYDWRYLDVDGRTGDEGKRRLS
jgi:acid phosphatase type 7